MASPPAGPMARPEGSGRPGLARGSPAWQPSSPTGSAPGTRSTVAPPRERPLSSRAGAAPPRAGGPIEASGPSLSPAEESGLYSAARKVELHGFLRTSLSRTSLQGGPADQDNRTGVSLDNIRVGLDADADAFQLYLSFEGSTDQGQGYLIKEGEGGELVVLDAWASLDLSEWLAVRVGQFRPPILFTSMIDENELLFLDRTFNGLVWQDREPGVQLHLVGDPFEGWLAVQDGALGEGSEVALTGRLAWRLFGEGEAPRREGAYDPDLGQTLYLAGSWHDDGSVDAGTALAAEAFYTWERVSLAGEIVDYGDGLLGHRFWSATGSVALVPDLWELSARYEDFTSRGDTYVMRLGLAYYLRGPTTKVLANLVRLEHDGADQVRTLIELGLVASF